MERFEVSKLGGQGYVSPIDARPYEVPANAMSRVFNIRMNTESAEVGKGWGTEAVLTNAGGGINAIDYAITSTGLWWLFFGDSGIYSIDTTGEYDVTNIGGPYTGTYPNHIWITDSFNGYPIATNGIDNPQVQEDISLSASTPFKDFPGWVAGAKAKVVAAYKNFIVAFNIIDGPNYENMVWWSDESVDGLVPTSWDYADPESRSGRTTLGTDSGAIVGVKKLRDSVFIYCENGVFRMDFVGGNAVFSFTEVFKNTGMWGPRCVEEYQGNHFVITNDDIIVHDGHKQQSIATKKIQKEFFSFLNDSQRNVIYTASHLEADAKEVWVAYNEQATTDYPTKAFVFDWHTNTWTIRPLPLCRYMKMLPVAKGFGVQPPGATYQDVCNQDPDTTNCLEEDVATPSSNFTIDNYAKYTEPFNSFAIVLGDLRFYGIGNTTSDKFYLMDRGYSYADSGFTFEDTVLEKEDINVTNDETVQMMVSIYPRVQGEAPIDIYVGGSITNEGPVRWKGPFRYTPQSNYKVSTRIRGRRFAVRFKPTGAFPFRLEGYDIVYTQAGMR